VHFRLMNWALWKARESGGGLGYRTQASFLVEASTDRYREAVIPVDEVEAGVTNQAVDSLKGARQHLWDTLQCIYPLALGVNATSRRLGCAPSTVKARLDQADAALAQWFRDRDVARRERVAATKLVVGGFTT
jgi:hypothetical protein